MRIMNRLVATEGRDKGGKLVLITSRLNAAGGWRTRKGERKEGKRSALVILTRPLPVMTGLFPFVRSFATMFSVGCVFTKTSRRRCLDFLKRDFLTQFSSKRSDTLLELVSMIFDFLSGMMGDGKKGSSNEE